MDHVHILSTAKRVTLKRSRPNPVFHDWLEELLEEAREKRCKLEHQLTVALTSLSKYPLQLSSGAECKILKGFDSRLCDYIELCLKHYNTQQFNQKHIVQPKPTHVSETVSTSYRINKRYTAQLINYMSILIGLKNLWVDGNDKVPMQVFLSHISKIVRQITKKLEANHNPGNFPKQLRTFRELLEIDSIRENVSLTDAGLSEAYYLEHILNDQNHNITSSTQTDALSPLQTESNIYDLTAPEDVTTIEMPAGSFDVILLIDKNETSGLSNKNDPTVAHFKKYKDLKHEYRSLKIGDFAWIAKHKIHVDQELVLPYIVERKRLDDLSASIKDGRFHEQKFRLRRCGLENVIYMVESYTSKKHVGLPVLTLMQTLANTRIQDGFKVHMTDSLGHSARFLAMMTKRLSMEYMDKTLKGRHAEAEGKLLMTYEFFNKQSAKNKALTVTETFIKLLLQLKGLSVEKALAITNVYRTPKSLIQAYEHLDKEEGELLLANLKYGELSRKVGPVVSKSIFQLFSSLDIS